MSLALVTPPASKIITLADGRAHLRVDQTDEDALIQIYIDAVDAHLDGPDGVLGRALVTQTWDWTLPGFPNGELRVPLPPLITVDSISYLDGAGAQQAVTSWQTYYRNGVGFIRPAFGAAWPAARAVPNAVTIRFTAGYGAASAVPAAIRAAAMLLLGSAFEQRSGEMPGSLAAVNRLLDPYRVLEFA